MAEKDLDVLYGIISNLVTREEFDRALGDCPSRNFVPFISQHTENMTLSQLKEITCGRKWAYMAVTGIAHVSWEDNCWQDLYHAWLKTHNWRKRNYEEHWSETWYQHRVCTWDGEDENGVKYSIIEDYRSPSTWSSSCRSVYSYEIKLTSEVKPEPTHVVAAISIQNGNAYLFDQFAGTQEECEDWVKNLYERGRHSGDVYTRMFPIDQPKRY